MNEHRVIDEELAKAAERIKARLNEKKVVRVYAKVAMNIQATTEAEACKELDRRLADLTGVEVTSWSYPHRRSR